MDIRNASATPSKSNQLRNVNTISVESMDITTQPGEAGNRTSEVIAFVVNAGMNITANNFYISSSVGLYQNSGLSMVNISSRYQEKSLNMSIRSYCLDL